MKKRVLAAILIFAMVLTVIAPLTVFADWEKQADGSWKYSESDGYYQNGFFEIGEKYYCFDENGKMVTGWIPIDSFWYYADPSSGVVAQGWKKINQKWYYFEPEYFYMYDEGIWTIGGKNYCFADSGAMRTGWFKMQYTVDEEGPYTGWFYAKPSGELASGWEKIGGTWYYFDKGGSWMYSDGIYEIGGQKYYFYPSGALGIGWIKMKYSYGEYYDWYYADSNGVLQTGWQKIGGAWYYFYPYGYNCMYYGDWYEIDGKGYFFDESGKMCTGWCSWTESYSDGYSYTYWYYANSNGELASGWQKIGNTWYYFHPGYYAMYTGVAEIEGEIHAFDSSGAWLKQKRGWLEVKNGSETMWYYINSDGTAATGWQTIGGTQYYFGVGDYIMYANGVFYIDGQYYAFAKSGALITGTGWQKFTAYGQTRWCYTQNGTPLTGWQTIDGVQYYFFYYGYMAAENLLMSDKIEMFSSSGAYLGTCKTVGWIKAEYSWYYVEDTDGTLAKGWREIKGVKYYFNKYSGSMYSDGTYYIDGKNYTFDSNGHCLNP